MSKLPCGAEICMHKRRFWGNGGGRVEKFPETATYGILCSVQLLCATHFICSIPFNPHVKENEIQGGDCL